jgi:AcrR family transcriptional regulator
MEPETHERKDVRRNREAVIEAALAILPDDPHASMATIAERSGLGRTTVYRHFPARNDLLLALFARVIDEARAVTSAVIEEGLPAAETLRALGPAIITIPDRFRFLHEVRSIGEEMIAETTVDPSAPVRQFLEAAQRRGEINADLPVQWINAAINGMALAAATEMNEGRLTVAEAGRVLGETMVRAFTVPGWRS